MAEEPGKCRYIMGILEKNKKSKGTAFVYDENNDYYKMEINGIEFVCDSIHSDYEKRAVELAQAYEKMATMYNMEADKLKEYMGEDEKENMKQDLAVQKAVELITDSVKPRAKAKTKKEKEAEAAQHH